MIRIAQPLYIPGLGVVQGRHGQAVAGIFFGIGDFQFRFGLCAQSDPLPITQISKEQEGTHGCSGRSVDVIIQCVEDVSVLGILHHQTDHWILTAPDLDAIAFH